MTVGRSLIYFADFSSMTLVSDFKSTATLNLKKLQTYVNQEVDT